MIIETEFKRINDEVKNGLHEVFEKIKNDNPTGYILFLADGEFKEQYMKMTPPIEPYVIDSREDQYIDNTRVKFFVGFLQQYYTFPKADKGVVADNDDRRNIELMVYAHIWESKPFLKKLFRLAALINHEIYPWNAPVPPMGKHDFIRNDIRQKFEDNKVGLFNVIKNGFHTSLRNAFAHSEYAFHEGERIIQLYNYGGAAWELKDISYDNWSVRFVYSVLLAYHLMDITYQRRTTLVKDLGKDIFTIDHPRADGTTTPTNIQYRLQHNAFGFVK